MNDIVFQDITLPDLPETAKKIIELYPDERIFALSGDLGAGKTTLIKEFCKVLGVAEAVTSPSFAIINEYDAGGIELVYHFDFYRIKKLEEVLDIGYEEYIYSGYYCFLEWSEKIEELLPDRYVFVRLEKISKKQGREIRLSLIS